MLMPSRDLHRQFWRQKGKLASSCVLTLAMLISGSGFAEDSNGKSDSTLDKLSSLLRSNLLLEAQVRQQALLAELDSGESVAIPTAAPPMAQSTGVDSGAQEVKAESRQGAPTALPQPVAIYGGGGAWVASLLMPDGKQVEVRTGQSLEKYLVSKIDATSVVLHDPQGKPYTLTLVGGTT